LKNLRANQRYYWSVQAVDSAFAGGPFGTEASFSINEPTTETAVNITAHSATLAGTVNPLGLATTGFFEYGPTTSYGVTSAIASLGSGNLSQPFSLPIAGLQPDTDYHYRALLQN